MWLGSRTTAATLILALARELPYAADKAVKEKKKKPFVPTWIQLEIIILSEVSQRKQDKYHRISLICGI